MRPRGASGLLWMRPGRAGQIPTLRRVLHWGLKDHYSQQIHSRLALEIKPEGSAPSCAASFHPPWPPLETAHSVEGRGEHPAVAREARHGQGDAPEMHKPGQVLCMIHGCVWHSLHTSGGAGTFLTKSRLPRSSHTSGYPKVYGESGSLLPITFLVSTLSVMLKVRLHLMENPQTSRSLF